MTSNEYNAKIDLIIKENFIEHKEGLLVDVYLINGIKMTSTIVEVKAGFYLILKDSNNYGVGGLANTHLICWSAIVTINQSGEKHNKENSLKSPITISQPMNQKHVFINKTLFIYLANGIKLDGTCIYIEYNSYIILEKNNNSQIILWHAVATMSFVNPHEEQLNTHISHKNNLILNNLINKSVAIFLKTGIKLVGKLTDFSSMDSGDKDWELVLDNKQLIRMQHVSTVTEKK